MRLHEVRVQQPGKPPPREQQLAWKIAAMATDPAPLDADAVAMAANRIIDNAACAVAALNRAPVSAARAQALAFPHARGATVFGLPSSLRRHCLWAGYANSTAVRELDFHDSFFAEDSGHPGDVISPLIAVAQQQGLNGQDLARGILTAYETQVSLIKGVALNTPYRIDHVAHLGPAVAAGLAAMLRLETETAYQAVQQAAHVSIGVRQARKGEISSWKACAPGHVGKAAIEAVDRAMRGETSPSPIYEGDYGLLAVLLGGEDAVRHVPLPEPGEPRRAILETYPKEHSAGYHGQAIIDLAFRMRGRIEDVETIRDVEIRTKRLTHLVMGSGAGDPQKWDPETSRETLDHSAMFIFAVALQDGEWHHGRSYAPERVRRADTVRLWRKVRTVEDPEWTRRFTEPTPLDKAHGAQVVITFQNGETLEDEITVADAHPRGARPWGVEDYARKFRAMAQELIAPEESERFLAAAARLSALEADGLTGLNVAAAPGRLADGREGLFRAEP